MNEKKRKISTCVYVHSILHHWACILMFEGHFVEYVCWWELVCELSETLHYLYSGFMYFESEMSDFLLRALYYCLFHHYIHCWCDFTSCLIWVDHYSSSCYLLCHHPRFAFYSSPLSYPCSSLTTTYSYFDTSCASSLHISLSDHFSSLSRYCYHVHIGHPQGHGSRDFLYMLHFIHEGMGFDHWVFESSFPSFLLPYHPSLHFIPHFKTTLRPWDQTSSSTTPA